MKQAEFSCPECGKIFHSSEEVEQHLKTVHHQVGGFIAEINLDDEESSVDRKTVRNWVIAIVIGIGLIAAIGLSILLFFFSI